MAHMTKDGKPKSSKFRASRYDREHSEDKEPKEPKGESEMEQGKEASGGGGRAEANRMMGKKEGNPEEHAEPDGDEGAEGMMEEHESPMEGDEPPAEGAPADHSEIQQVTADHGPAHTVHMAHDHASGRSHVHSVHADGHEHHADHEGQSHVMNAHHHAMHAAGTPPLMQQEPEAAESPMGGIGDDEHSQPL